MTGDFLGPNLIKYRSLLNFVEKAVVHEGDLDTLGIRKRSSERIAVLQCCSAAVLRSAGEGAIISEPVVARVPWSEH